MKPNSRIKKVFKEKCENVRKPMGEIMREMGYAISTSKHPDKVTGTKSWEMLCDKYLPDDLILDTHKEAFVANRTISARTMGNADEKTDDFVDVPTGRQE